LFSLFSTDPRLPPELRKRTDLPVTIMSLSLVLLAVSVLSMAAVIRGHEFGLQGGVALTGGLALAQVVMLIVLGNRKEDWDPEVFNGLLISGIVLGVLQVTDLMLLWTIMKNMPDAEVEEERLSVEHERLLRQEQRSYGVTSAA